MWTFLHKHRKAAGLNLAQLARACGTIRQTTWLWENGGTAPVAPKRIAALAQALGISVTTVVQQIERRRTALRRARMGGSYGK